MISIVKDGSKTYIYCLSTDDKEDAYEAVTDKNDIVIFREMDTGKDYVFNDDELYEYDFGEGGGGGGIGDLSWIGEDPELLYTNTDTFTLADTDYSSWTPSTTAGVILNGADLGTIDFKMSDLDEFDLVQICNGATYFSYNDGESILPRALATSLFATSTTTETTSTTMQSPTRSYTKYINGSGEERKAAVTAAVYFSYSNPSISVSTCSIHSPYVYAKINDTYFTTTAASAVNVSDTVLTWSLSVYKVKKGTSPYGYAVSVAGELLDANPPTPPSPASEQ